MPSRPRHQPQPEQLCLALDDPRNRPPAAPATPEILETLAELLLTAADKMAGGSQDDARKDNR
jgi:hypothetical protein